MILQNSSNQQFSNNADGFSLGGGLPTTRTLTLSGDNLSVLLSSVATGNLLQFNGTNWINISGSSFIGSSISGAGAISVINGTVSLVTDGEFAQTGGTLSLGNITPTSITTSGTVATGALTATSGSFSSNLNVSGSVAGSSFIGTIGSFSGALTGGTIIGGDIQGSNGTFSGAVNVTGTISASNLVGTNTGDQTITLTGDVTGSGTGSFATTLANTTVTAGTYGSSNTYPTFTVDSKGRLTAAGTVALATMAFQNANNVNITGGTITGLPTPTNPTDAATKAYVDGVAAGLDAKQAVAAATTGTLNATYSTDVLTEVGNGALVIDGYTALLGDRILVKNQIAPNDTQNGIYVVTATGDAGTPYILTRTADMDASAEVPAAYTFVIGGTSQAGIGYVVTGFPATGTIDVNPITWTQFSQAGAYTAGQGLKINTSGVPAIFSMDLTTLVAGTFALGSTDIIPISNGTVTVYTTLGSLATEIAGASVFGTDAIHVNSGTVSLVTDGEFAQTGGTLSLGNITPTSITTSGTVATGALTATSGSFSLGLDVTGAANISGTVKASNIATGATISGTNTGDQTITLTGPVTTGAMTNGSFATTLVLSALSAGTAISGTDLLAISQNGTTVQTTVASLAAEIGSTAIVGTQAIYVTGGTVSLLTDSSLTQTTGTLSVASTGVTAGTYGNTYSPAIITVNAAGQITTASTGTITLGTGSVTQIDTGTYLVGGPITNTGTISHGTSGVSAGTYGLVVVDAYGHVTQGYTANIPWVDVTTTSQQMTPNYGYMTDNAGTITLTLPTSANFGDVIEIVGFGPGNWIIAQNPGQTIHFGVYQTTTGTAGYLQSNHKSDSLEIFCKSSTDFIIRNSVGNISIA